VCFAPLARTLFFAARLFATPKNVSLGPSVPMSTFSKPPEPMLPRNCRRHVVKNVRKGQFMQVLAGFELGFQEHGRSMAARSDAMTAA